MRTVWAWRVVGSLVQGFLGVPLTSGDRRKERRKVMQANSRSQLLQEFPAEVYIKK